MIQYWLGPGSGRLDWAPGWLGVQAWCCWAWVLPGCRASCPMGRALTDLAPWAVLLVLLICCVALRGTDLLPMALLSMITPVLCHSVMPSPCLASSHFSTLLIFVCFHLASVGLSLQLYRLINPSVASHRSDCCKHAYTGLEGHSNLTLLAMTSLGLLEPNSAPAPLCLSARFADWNAP